MYLYLHPMGIKENIQQRKPFVSEYHKAQINVLYTASWMGQASAAVLKPFEISWQQFNVLRILNGMAPEPASIKILTERMIDKSSNASRLVDKLRVKGLVDRQYCPADRRKVNITLTERGKHLLKKASAKMEGYMSHYSEKITEAEAAELNRILDKMRE
jgi:DNA-binding MarR family transcriptional regulator